LINKKPIHFVGDHPMNIPSSLFPIGPLVLEKKIAANDGRPK